MGQISNDDCELGGGLDATEIQKFSDKDDEHIWY
jgi:hypothetical protein